MVGRHLLVRRAYLLTGAAIAALAYLLAVPAAMGQDLEPRQYSPAPVGVNFLINGYAYTQGGVAFDGALIDAIRACWRLRAANRVVLELAAWPAPDDDALYRGARSLVASTEAGVAAIGRGELVRTGCQSRRRERRNAGIKRHRSQVGAAIGETDVPSWCTPAAAHCRL